MFAEPRRPLASKRWMVAAWCCARSPPAGAKLTETIADGFRSVLWPRAYADLRISGVRGEDAAEHLREEMTTL